MTDRRRVHGVAWPSGLYVVDFGDRIKVGRSWNMRWRIHAHRQSGARRFAIIPTSSHGSETNVLRLLRKRARQIGQTESFRGIRFATAVRIVQEVVEQDDTRWVAIYSRNRRALEAAS